MATTTPTANSTLQIHTETAQAHAARCLYDAETALHAARQSGVDVWITAAYDRLHDAITTYDSVTTPPTREQQAA